jgi:hypothetical protein
MKDTKLITIISQPRSGTNFIINNIFQKLIKTCICGELFREKPYIPERYYYENMGDEYKKQALVDRLLECCDEDYLIHKVFADQVTEDEIKLLIRRSDIVCFILRNHIDRYISYLKAVKTSKFINYDYTGVKVVFDQNEFASLMATTERWFETTSALCDTMGKPTMAIDYDELTILTERDQILYCRDQLTQLLGEELCIDFEKEHFTVTKQDHSTSYSDMISNYEEVKEFIAQFRNLNLPPLLLPPAQR